MKKKFLVLPLLVLAIAIGGAYFWQQHQNGEEDQLTLYGNVDIREAQLAFNSSEHIDAILVQEGDYVKKGQLLARLHTEVLDARLAEARAQLEALLADKDALTRVLTYHVIQGRVEAAEVVRLYSVETIEGQPVKIHVGESVMVNNARVVKTDISTSNGVIHVIDTVMLPPDMI